ncbi:DUF4333 domain-containing protein [Blastococcus sp. TF02-8]|uniref:DUF4333 domain-containing protein n=1 Tax=Blastococcus sp. TF02-8 TaxID=2250574 RepID=UPI00197AEAEA|nr:DUF4333 domain-containing protein [Blastococcus sp. TF02-8]
MPARVAVVLGGAGLLLTACGTDPATAAQVAAEAERVLEQRTGVAADVTCPEELPPEAGAELRCVLVPDGEAVEYGVTVTVTAVDDDVLDLDVQVDDEPSG